MYIAAELRSLADQLVRQRNSGKTLCMNRIKNCGAPKRDQVEGETYTTMLEELEVFQEHPEQKLNLAAKLSTMEMRAVTLAPRKMGLEVEAKVKNEGVKVMLFYG